MTVSLVWATPNAERLIVKMARVSNPANEDNWETGPKLIKYLLKHKHWSPMEMACMCVKIETERDISAQILRHRTFTFQEFSTRYAKSARAETPWFRRQDTKNRQNSFSDIHPTRQEDYQRQASYVIGQAFSLYDRMLQDGVAKETARRILPLCTGTTLYMQGTLRSWYHYISLRSSEDTQLEHRRIAIACREIFKQQFPAIAEAAFE
jgi:thymidylate synthase (FAD)